MTCHPVARAAAVALALTLACPTGAAEDFDALRARLQAEKAKLSPYAAELGDLRANLVELDSLKSQTAIPRQLDVPDLLASVSKLAAGCQAELTAFKPGQETGKPPLLQLPVSISLSVERASQAACVAQGIGRLDRLVSLDEVQVDAGSERAEARLSLTTWVYRPKRAQPPARGTPELPPLPAGAPKDVARLHAEVGALQKVAREVLELKAERDRLEESLALVAEVGKILQDSGGLGSAFRAIVSADPHPARIRFAQGKLVVAGRVENELLKAALAGVSLPDGWQLDLSDLTVRPRPPPVEPAQLQALGHEEGALLVTAVDADGAALRSALGLLKRPMLLVADPTLRVTGRIRSTDAGAALEILAKQEPRLGAGADLPKAARRGRGRKVSLQFHRVRAADVLRLLGEVGRVNVVAPGELPRLSMTIRDTAWDGVLKGIATALGRRIHKRTGAWFLLSEGQSPPRPKAPLYPKLSLELRGALAADALELIRSLVEVRLETGCQEGDRLDLHMHNSTPREALAAVQLLSGAVLSPQRKGRGLGCLPPPARFASGDDLVSLVGTGTSSKTGVALVLDSDGGKRLIRSGDVFTDKVRARVRPGNVVLQRADQSRVLDLPALVESGPLHGRNSLAEFARLRLSATISGGKRGTALFEDPRDGSVRLVQDGQSFGDERFLRAQVAPGKVVLVESWRDFTGKTVERSYSFFLRRRVRGDDGSPQQ